MHIGAVCRVYKRLFIQRYLDACNEFFFHHTKKSWVHYIITYKFFHEQNETVTTDQLVGLKQFKLGPDKPQAYNVMTLLLLLRLSCGMEIMLVEMCRALNTFSYTCMYIYIVLEWFLLYDSHSFVPIWK